MEQGRPLTLDKLCSRVVALTFLLALLSTGCKERSPAAVGTSRVQTGVAREEPDTEGLSPVQKAALRHRDALLIASRESPAMSEALRGSFDALLEESGQALQEPESEAELVEGLYSLGRFPKGFEEDTGFIELPSVTKTLAAALGSEYKQVAERALTYLLEYGRVDTLALASDTIRAGLKQNLQPDGDRLLALLPLSRDERKRLLAQGNLAVDIRARLGDRTAESAILSKFRRAADYSSKRSAAKALGYAATPTCAKALLEAMSSEFANHAPYFKRSIRCDLIEQLARIEPTETLFTKRYQLILRAGEGSYGLDATRDYLAEIADWGERRFQVQLGSFSEGPLLVSKKIVVRPL